ncbi:MAG TPA: hypothetical protein VFF09_02655, partial [archaeon]|nr:hypothetical protein [archaeon]
NQFIAGLLLGLSVWFRGTNAVIILAFLIGAQLKSRKNTGNLRDKLPLSLLLGAIVSVVPSLIVTQLMLGTPWGYTYLANEFDIHNGFKQDFDIFKMAEYTGRYGLFLLLGIDPLLSRGLMLLFPLTLVALLKAKHLRAETLLAAAFIIMIFSFSAIVPDGRYFIPLMPLFLFALVPFADQIIERVKGKTHGVVDKAKVIYAIALIFLVTTGVIFLVQSEKTGVKYAVSQKIYGSTNEGSLLVDTAGGHTVSFLFEKFGDRRVEVMTARQLSDNVQNTCWVKVNGGLGNIYSSIVTLYPRTEFSIQAFMKTDRVEVSVKPLEEFLKENGITKEMISCR